MKLSKPESVGFSAARLERVSQGMQRYVDEGKFAGIVTLIARRGKIVHFEACGQQEIASDTPMARDTLFRIYSMTKPITTTAAMMLYEEGALRLNDPVSKFIPAFAKTQVVGKQGYAGHELLPQSPVMNIQHLMTHTAGLSYGWWQDSPADAVYRAMGERVQRPDLTLAEFVDILAEAPLVFQPGSAWRYSYATDVLGRVVEVASGMSLRDFFQQRIFAPLGMKDTDYQVATENLPRYAAIYGPSPTGGIKAIEDYYTARKTMHNGGHGLVSTAADYLRFCQMILNNGELDGVRLLGRKTVELMGTNHLPAGLPVRSDVTINGHGFGLGFSVLLDLAQHQQLGSLGTLGWGGAANTNFWIDRQEEMIGILMTQFMPSDTFPVVHDFRVLTYQAVVD